MIDFYRVSFNAVHAKQNELLQQAAHDRLVKHYTSRLSFVRQVARSLGYIMVRWGLRLLQYGRINQTVLIHSQQIPSRSIRSN